jgi:hypothetical protein
MERLKKKQINKDKPKDVVSYLSFVVDSHLSSTPHSNFLFHHHFFVFLVLQSPISFPTLYPQGVSITCHRPSVTTRIPSTSPSHFFHFNSFHLKLFPSRHHLPALQIFNACNQLRTVACGLLNCMQSTCQAPLRSGSNQWPAPVLTTRFPTTLTPSTDTEIHN